MLIDKKGDLLKSDCTVIMHQCNCFSTMGAGIAKSIAKKYPEALRADRDLALNPKARLGHFSTVTVGNITIANLYGQFHYGAFIKQTNYEMLENALDEFFTFAKTKNYINLDKVGIPNKMGCGLAGGNWKTVHEILERVSNKHNIDIYIYKL